jgi:hypothetical protein
MQKFVVASRTLSDSIACRGQEVIQLWRICSETAERFAPVRSWQVNWLTGFAGKVGISILGVGRQVISERLLYFTSKQDHPKTSTCFVRVFLSETLA